MLFCRFKKLDRMDEDRQVILFNHLGFMECPSRERCYFGDMCAENDLVRVLDKRTFR